MDIQLPAHLRALAADPARKGDALTMRLRCPCGCGRFRVEKNTCTEEEKRQMEAHEAALKKVICGYTFRRLPDGRFQHRRNLFGLIPLRWKNFDMPPAPCWWDVQCIRVICAACRAEHLVFDSRLHGFDAWAAEWPADTMAWQPHWRCVIREGAVTVTVRPRDPALLMEENPELAPEDCANLYESISIRYITNDGHSREILSRETA